jgi:hypothetical protein
MDISSKDLEVFLDVFHKLDGFEAQQYCIRGYGVFDRTRDILPIPEVVKVLKYLEGLRDIMGKDVVV